jgi:NAD(P)-dependent dehydrogenase (short-subunit alcohol dehydrogenase family)
VTVDLQPPSPGFGSDAIHFLQLDICDNNAPERIMLRTEQLFGRLDIVFNNAGIAQKVPLADMCDADWDRMMNVNVRAAFRLTRCAIPLLSRSPAGRIIATASAAATLSAGGLGAYETSKAALAVLMRAFAADLGVLGITANAILPGPTRTALVQARLNDPEHVRWWEKHTFLRRLGEPQEVARAALFFASSDSSNVTGQMLAVDGGFASSL